ncbi:MAG: chloride channel protein [Bacteriovoracaceae bacterium]|nr:chloride channel protein [Bacteriovoracaceae bacterium]
MGLSEFWNNRILKFLLKNSINEERTYFVLTLIVGLLAAVVAVGLHKLTHFLVEFFGTQKPFELKAFLWGGFALFVSGYLTTRKFPSTSGSGIPGVRVGLAVYHGRITIVQTIMKFITSVLSLSSGFSLGREGPTAAIAAGIGSYFGQIFHLSKRKVKALVAIGAAGGIAAAFNTPIAAVVFTLEEIVGDLNAKVLGNIVISSVVASIAAHLMMGNSPTFQALEYKLGHPLELGLYVLVGLATAIMGPIWTKSVLLCRDFNMKIFKGHRLTIIMVTFLLIAGISYIRPEVLGSGHGTIEDALLNLFKDWRFLLSLFVLKFFATTICYGSGVSGGLFLPTLLMGATLGSLCGSVFQLVFPDIGLNIGAFALVGMGSYFVSVIRAPFTSIIMVFEMTRDYHIILPLMIANMVSYYISSKLHEGSIYESISEQDGVHLPTKEDNEILESLIVEDAMVESPFSINANLSIKDAHELIEEEPYSGFPILKNGLLVGMVAKSDIKQAIAKEEFDKPVMDIAEKKIITIYPDQSLMVAFHKLDRFHVSRLPVVSRINDKRMIGIITAENIVSRFGYHIANKTHREE